MQIIPTTTGIKKNLENELSVPGAEIGQKTGKSFMGTLVKTIAGTAALKTAVDGVKKIIANYADYEQLVGGAELMFGDAYDFIAEKAKGAFASVQMSQNDYLQQVNGLATGLKTALGGNAQAAAELADRVLTAEADVVAATGNSQEAVQNAFNGIMKSNYTMLDNLQLGITPTKAGFQELIDKVNQWNAENGVATQYTIDNVADAQAALVDYISMQGLAGYAANEASETISGAAASMKAAWSNLLTGLADENANFSDLVGNFTESLVTYADNLMPRIGQAMDGVGMLLTSFAETVLPKIIDYIIDDLPHIISTGINIVVKLSEGLIKAIPQLVQKIPQIITAIVGGLKSAIPELLNVGVQMIKGVWDGIVSMGSWIKEKVKNFFSGVTDAVKGILGIHSPSKVFAGIGGYMAEGLGVGFGGEIDRVQRDIKNDMGGLVDGVTMSGASINASVSGGVASNQTATQIGEQTFNLVLDGSVVSSFLVDVVRKEVRMA